MTGSIPPIGTLTDRVQLKRRIVSDEDEGGELAVFSPIATVWARVRELSARPLFESDARGQAITHAVVLRFRNDLKPGDRIAYRGGDLDIAGTGDLNGRKAYLSCQCVARVVSG